MATTLENLATAQQVADRYPDIFTRDSLRQMMRPGNAQVTGFADCMVILSPRKRFIDLDKLPSWIEKRAQRGAA